VNGRSVCVFAKDVTVFGGALAEAHARKITKVQDLALRGRAPIVGLLFDALGARIEEGVAALGGYGEIFQRNVLASGVIPQISLIMGACEGGDVHSPALTNFIFKVRDTSHLFLTGPDIAQRVTNESVTAEELGGALVHTTTSSIADGAYDNDVDALLQIRRLFDFLPQSIADEVPQRPSFDDCDRVDLSLDTPVPAVSCRRARLCRRRHHAARDPPKRCARARHVAAQDARAPLEEARQHSAFNVHARRDAYPSG